MLRRAMLLTGASLEESSLTKNPKQHHEKRALWKVLRFSSKPPLLAVPSETPALLSFFVSGECQHITSLAFFLP